MSGKIADVGAQDPESLNSPVAWEADDDTEALRAEIPDASVCYFNAMQYANGTIVKSGTVMLRCDHGIWVPAGPSDPDNP